MLQPLYQFLVLFSKDIFHNPPYSILSRERYNDFVFFRLTSSCFVFLGEFSQISRFNELRLVLMVVFLSSSAFQNFIPILYFQTKKADSELLFLLSAFLFLLVFLISLVEAAGIEPASLDISA